MKKKCTKCQKILFKDEFRKISSRNNKPYPSCNVCENKARRYQNRINKLKVIGHYSNESFQCACCFESNIEFLTIDHINNDGAEKRRTDPNQSKIYNWIISNNYPKDMFRILCINCNFSIGQYGYCPHHKNSKSDFDIPMNEIYKDNPKGLLGEANHASKISESDVPKIRAMKIEGLSLTKIGKIFNLSKSAVKSICDMKSWKHIK